MSSTPHVERRYATGGVSLAGLAHSPGATSAVGNGRTISGTAVMFNRWSEVLNEGKRRFRERMLPGAFSGGVLNDHIIACFNHIDHMVMASSRGGVGTLKLRADSLGLHYEFEADPEQSYARDLIVALRRGDVSGSSFAFSVNPADESWEDGEDGMRLRTIRRVAALYDVCPVTLAAYGDNTSAGVRDAGAAPTRQWKPSADLLRAAAYFGVSLTTPKSDAPAPAPKSYFFPSTKQRLH